MIKINLLPENLRKTGKKELLTTSFFRIPPEIIIGVGGGLIVFLIAVDILFGVAIVFKGAKGQFYEQKKASLLPEGKTGQIVTNELRDTNFKINGIREILNGPLLVWSQQLNNLSDIITKGVWFRQINFADKTFLINGSAVSKTHNEVERVQEFVANLKKDPLFTKFFQKPELGDQKHRSVSSLEIIDFTINAQVK